MKRELKDKSLRQLHFLVAAVDLQSSLRVCGEKVVFFHQTVAVEMKQLVPAVIFRGADSLPPSKSRL